MKDFKQPYQHQRINKHISIQPKRDRRDKFSIGLIMGLIMPMIGFITVWIMMYADYPLGAVFKWLIAFDSPRVLNEVSKLISLGLIANLIPFYLFLNKKRYQATKGVILASFIYLIIVFVYLVVLQ